LPKQLVKCPFCGADETAVADTRLNDEGDIVRRRRKCNACDKRFTTYERAEIRCRRWSRRTVCVPSSIATSCGPVSELALRKRPVSIESVDAAVADIEEMLLSPASAKSAPSNSASWSCAN
jgi:transcriptional repressor NrdR